MPEAYAYEPSPPSVAWSARKADLGRRLFSDPLLSRNKTVSCATCHRPEQAFTDGRQTARGIRGQVGSRNTPSIVNRALGRQQFWDGRAASLEAQALGPIANPLEMDLPIDEAVARLRAHAGYRKAFLTAFGGAPSAPRLAEALAAYERTIYSVNAPFDRYLAGEKGALRPSAQRGLALFGGKARCGECHVGPNFTDEEFYALGVGTDPGRGGVTGDPKDVGSFKTPTLREVARTAPYMHDGSLATLEEVVDYYDKGCSPHPNLASKIQRLELTAEEKADLVAFLHALTGEVVEAQEERDK